MSAPVELIPMFCIRCQNAIPAQPDEVAWVCGQCSQGLLLSDEKGLTPLDFHYAADIPAGAGGKPFWVAAGKVDIRRTAFRGDRSGEMLTFWQTSRRFFIPAFELPLEEGTALGVNLLRQSPVLKPGSPAKFAPITVPPEDMRPLAEFIILSIEAERKDDLKTVEFQLQLEEPQLWVLP